MSSIQVIPTIHPLELVLGYPFTLTCNLTKTSSEQLQNILLSRKRSEDSDFVTIIRFPPPALPEAQIAIMSKSVETRSTTTRPGADDKTSAMVTIEDSICSDVAVYMWTVSYITDNEYKTINKTSEFRGKEVRHNSRIESSLGCTYMQGALRVVLCTKKLHFISRNWHKEKK